MRVSDSQFSQMMLRSLQVNNAGLAKAMQQMSTGERLTKLSDDPMASIQLLNLGRESAALAQYKSNIANVKTALSNQEVHLDSVNDSLQNLNDKVLWGANGTLTDGDRAAIIIEIESLRDSVVSSLNAQDEGGRYLFSGTKTDSVSISNVSGTFTLEGNNDKRLVTVAKGVSMESNVTAKELLDLGGNDLLNQLDTLIAEFRNPSAAFRATVDSTLDSIEATSDNVLAALTEIGGRHNNLDLLNGAHVDTKLFVDKIDGDLSALDYGEASVRLSRYMSALQATQASYTKIDSLSLFDRL
ncbi:flagellar hook-associated protein FlgL [Vibrio caribbeanicus]|uniref:Flagellar hook-associated protein FlgL n=1 Tax=Vibrio caribbeanicus ATCC BAA-2122 TaxID=796620 RepID=E3BPF0_9VIBR|nr:flagellar hook-associated protein FlgL [Vibrio caribbeanicus]EFP95039.1 flagellar hook-associated protein FlgL [Vibrio caribbeanicus ATCC BAA-2122]